MAVGIFKRAEVSGPGRLACQRKGGTVSVGKKRIHAAPVRGHGRSGIAGGIRHLRAVRAVGNTGHGLLPENLAGLGVETDNLALARITTGKKNLAGPDDRRAKAPGGRWNLPGYPRAGLGIPACGRVCGWREAVAVRTEKARPVLSKFRERGGIGCLRMPRRRRFLRAGGEQFIQLCRWRGEVRAKGEA